MRTFDVQGIEIHASRAAVFDFVSDPRKLPKWAHAFQQLEGALDAQRATLREELAQLKRLLEAQ